MKVCHNCRRNRLRCDGSIPTCLKCHSSGTPCLGYGNLFRWTNSVASRGKMMGKTFDTSEPKTLVPLVRDTSDTEVHQNGSISVHLVSNLYQPLGDPTFHDLSASYKFYLSYCKCLFVYEAKFVGLWQG
jgi:hypothetical protein